MKKTLKLMCACALLVLSACATPYSSEGLTGGYGQMQLEPGIWRVTFSGNGYTTSETVQTFWLYRCAELTLEKGYDGFEILSNIQLVSNLPGEEGQFIPVHGGGGGVVFFGSVSVPAKPVLQADIKLLRRPFKVLAPKSFDAAALKAKLEPLVKGQLCDGNVCPHVHHYLMPDTSA